MGQVKQAQKDQKVLKVKHVTGHSKSIFSSKSLFQDSQKSKAQVWKWDRLQSSNWKWKSNLNLSSKVWNRKSRIEDQKLPMNCPQNGRCVNSRIIWRNTGHFRKKFKTMEIPIWTITSDFEVHGDFLRNYRSNFLEQPSGSLAVEQLKVKIKVWPKIPKDLKDSAINLREWLDSRVALKVSSSKATRSPSRGGAYGLYFGFVGLFVDIVASYKNRTRKENLLLSGWVIQRLNF